MKKNEKKNLQPSEILKLIFRKLVGKCTIKSRSITFLVYLPAT